MQNQYVTRYQKKKNKKKKNANKTLTHLMRKAKEMITEDIHKQDMSTKI